MKSLPVGSKLARNLYDNEGKLLLARGMVLENRHLEQLIQKGYEEVYIWDDSPNEESDKSAAGVQTRPSLSPHLNTALDHVKEFMLRVTYGHAITKSQVEETIDLICPEIMGTTNILRTLEVLRKQNEYTLKHSVSVSAIAIKLGQTMGLPEEALRTLGIAGLMHDIGKCKISPDLLNKADKLTDEEWKEMQKHPVHGFKIVYDIDLPNTEIVTAVLQHHEHQDGKGYPFHVNGSNLHIYSRIIAVADVFDALTSERPYRGAIPVFEALDEVVNNSKGHLDPIISRKLSSYVMNVIPGERVRLDDGSVGLVVLVNHDEPHRPIVKVGDQFVNLKEQRNRYVVDIATSY